jgi:hypothetical protein
MAALSYRLKGILRTGKLEAVYISSAPMLFHFSIFFWSVAFFFGMWSVASDDSIPFWSGYLFSIGVLSLISLVSAKRITKRLRNSFVPLLLSFSAPSLLSLIDAPGEKFAFSLLSATMFYVAFLALYRLRFAPTDRTARSFLSIAGLASLFFFYAAAYGFYLNFSVPLASLVAVFATGSFGAAYQTLYPILPKHRTRVALYSSVIAFGMGEISWMLSFWPFGYLTAGSAALGFFFILWDMAGSLFSGTLSRKRTIVYLIVVLALVGLLVGTSPWDIRA